MSKNLITLKNNQESHISYSEFKTFTECPYKRYLQYEKRIETPSNIYMDYGTAIHECTQSFYDQKGEGLISYELRLKKVLNDHPEVSDKEKKSFFEGGRRVAQEVIRGLKRLFNQGYELAETEKFVWTPTASGIFFKGYIDFLLRKGEGWHILDLKTTTKGWKPYKFKDEVVLSQLRLYKHFYAKQEGVSENGISTYYIFGKRDTKIKPVEFVKIESGKGSTARAIKALDDATYLIQKGDITKAKDERQPKRFSPCKYCEFNHTEHCP